VFLNLVLNAVDATVPGGRVELGAGSEPNGLRVWVRDNGAGIAPENCDRLFQPYFTTKHHGTGLGLFMARKLLAGHGGTIECESMAGAGTTFVVRLPAVQEERDGSYRDLPAASGVG
jgi:signal transduction histidine kinase